MFSWLSPYALFPLAAAGGSLFGYLTLRQIVRPAMGLGGVLPIASLCAIHFVYALCGTAALSTDKIEAARLLYGIRWWLVAAQAPVLVWLHAHLRGQGGRLPWLAAGSMALLMIMVALDLPNVDFQFIQLPLGFRYLRGTLYMQEWALFAIHAIVPLAVASEIARLDPHSYSRKTLAIGYLGYLVALGTDTLTRAQGLPIPPVSDLGQLLLLVTYARAAGHKLVFEYQRSSALNTLRGRLMDSLSHELRTPLGVVKGYAEMMDKELLGPLTDAQRNALRITRENIEQEIDLIDDLLLTAYFERGIATRLEQVDLQQQVAETVSKLDRRFRGKELQVRIETDQSVLVEGDSMLLQKMLEKLLVNAYNYTTDASRISIRMRTDDTTVTIDIEDQGPGVDPAILSLLSLDFAQVEAGENPLLQGLGLGLFLSRQIADLHHGSLTLQNHHNAETGHSGLLVQLVLPRVWNG